MVARRARRDTRTRDDGDGDGDADGRDDRSATRER